MTDVDRVAPEELQHEHFKARGSSLCYCRNLWPCIRFRAAQYITWLEGENKRLNEIISSGQKLDNMFKELKESNDKEREYE